MSDLTNDCLVILSVEFRRRLYMFHAANMKWHTVIPLADGNSHTVEKVMIIFSIFGLF